LRKITNKAEITKAIADKSGLAVLDSENFLKFFTEVVEKALSKGDDVVLIGFGTFSRVKRGARVARNFQTGEQLYRFQSPERCGLKSGRTLRKA
jgi:DNA-binding protein HU-beta